MGSRVESRCSIWLTGKFPDSNAASYRVSCISLNMAVLSGSSSSGRSLVLKGQFHCNKDTKVYHRKPPKNLRYPRRTKLPPDSCLNGLSMLPSPFADDVIRDDDSFDSLVFDENEDNVDEPDELFDEGEEDGDGSYDVIDEENEEIVWEQDEIEAISSLFKGRVPQKPGSLERRRPLPLPLPYKKKPLGFPTQKMISRKSVAPARQSMSSQLYKNPSFLVGLAREIKALSPEEKNVSSVLDKWARFLRKGSLSMTIRELGHMGLPERALLVFCWAQKEQHLYPDDRILASTVEVLARSHELKRPFMLHKDDRFMNMVSQSVYEAIVKGFIKGGSLNIAWELLSAARASNRLVYSGVYAKLILKLGKNPDKEFLVTSLLEELAGREDLNLDPQDCTAIMKVCIRFGKFEIAEGLYDWFKRSGRISSVVMYTTMIHSRYSEKRYREAMTIVWEMEASNCLLDLPAYRVVMKLFVALNDLQRGARYFSKLKEAGFSPTFDIYMYMIQMYMESGRIAKCKEVWLEAEAAGFKMDEQTRSELFEPGNQIAAN